MDNNRQTILRITKITIKGISINLAYASKVEFYESLSQPGITGFITINDYQALQEIGDVFSNDEIVFTFGIEGNESDYTLKYTIYTNDGSRHLTRQTYDVLRLGFCSPWMIDALTRNLSKPYGTVDEPMKISDIVKDLLTECGAEIGYIEPTKQVLENFVTPLWTPYHSIKYLLGFATNEDMKGGYICWTDFKTGKVNVTSLDYLLQGTLGKFESFTVNATNPRYVGSIIEMNFETNYDSIRMVTNGLPNTIVASFNYDKTKYMETNKNVNDDVLTRLGKFLPIPTRYQDDKYLNVEFTPLFPPTAESIASDDSKLTDMVDGFLLNKYAFMSVDTFKLNIKTRGETNRRAGWLANLKYPSADAKNMNRGSRTENKQYAGDYLIREIKHEFGLNVDYTQYVTLVSDGFQEFSGDGIKW